MRRIFIIILTLASVTAAIAQTRTFSINGQYITIDVASTIDDYYKASLNGRWTCIPAVLEYAAEKANLSLSLIHI